MSPLASCPSLRIAALLLALSLGGASAAPAPESPVIARSGDVELKVEEVRAYLENLSPREQAALVRTPAALNQNVRLLAAQQLVIKEALAKQWDRRPEVVARIERARRNAIVESYLRSLSTPPADYPTATEVRAVYDANQAAFEMPRQLRLAQIFLSVPRGAEKGADEKARAKLEAVRKQPETFAVVARTDSDDKLSGGRGGEIGWSTEEQIQAEIRPQVLALKKGELSEPLRLNDGWHLIKVLDLQEAAPATFEEVRPQITRQLREERIRAGSQAYLAKLLQEKPVTVNDALLAREIEALSSKISKP
ncbi:MAG: peptidylprolyl isomerase [Verrucomicrobiia bacterium]